MRIPVFVLLVVLTSSQIRAQEITDSFIPSADLIIRADSLRMLDKNLEAIALFNQVQKGDTNYVNALIKKSSTMLDLKQYDEGLAACREGMKIPRNKEKQAFWLNLAYTLNKKGDSISSLTEYEALCDEYPFYRLGLYNRAIQYGNAAQYDSSYSAYKSQVILFPFDVNAHLNLGLFALNEGHFTEAFLALNTALMLDPDGSKAITILRLLNEVSNNTKIEKEPKPGFKLESQEFKDIDLLIENYVALKKDYKVDTDVDIYLAKQNHLIFSQLKTRKVSDYFFSSYYAPFFNTVMESGKFNLLQVLLILSSENENHKKLVSKKLKDLKTFNLWLRDTWNDQHNIQTFASAPYQGTYRVWYNNNSNIEAISKLAADNTQFDGTRAYFYDNGCVSAEGPFRDDQKEGEWRYYYEDGTLKQVLKFDKGKLNGSAETFHENGIIDQELTFADGEKSGAFQKFYLTGRLYEKGSYSNDFYEGKVNYFFPNEVLEYDTQYKSGELTGILAEYYPDQKIYRKESYTSGVSNGSYEIFWPNDQNQIKAMKANNEFEGSYLSAYYNGKTNSEGLYNAGLKTGLWTAYYSNGKLKSQGTYSKGKLEGTLKEYSSRGILMAEKVFKNDFIISFRFFDEKGGILFEGGDKKNPFSYKSYNSQGRVYLEGLYSPEKGQIGEWKEFDTYGNLAQTYSFDDLERSGDCLIYYPWGDTKEKYTYKKGLLHGSYRKYYPGGQLEKRGFYADGDLEGIWLSYHPDGTIMEESFYQNGIIKGINKIYAVNGKLDYTTEYDDGMLVGGAYFDTTGNELSRFVFKNYEGIHERNHYNGNRDFRGKYTKSEADSLFTWYSHDGKLETEGRYISGQKTGVWKWFHENGKLETEGEFLNGNKAGIWKEYFDDGSLMSETPYEYGDRTGKFVEYYRDGNIERTIEYWMDEINGNYVFYDETGELEVGRTYREGALISYFYLNAAGDTISTPIAQSSINVEGFFSSGKPSRSFHIEKGVFVGNYRAYHSNGNMVLDYELKHDERHGTYKSFYSNGNLKLESSYIYGVLHGPYAEYYESGTKKMLVEYVNDEKHGEQINYDEKGKVLSKALYYNGEYYVKL